MASSADGTKLVAVGYAGYVSTSKNFGATWMLTIPVGGQEWAPGGRWGSVASSADGTKLAAVARGITTGGGYIYMSADSGATWTQQTGPQRSWTSVASSSDGTKLVAMTNDGFTGGYIYTSSDSGVTWTQTTAPLQPWWSVASSSDGTKLVAAADDGDCESCSGIGGYIYMSADSGATWTQTTAPPQYWWSVASSSDGTKLVAVSNAFFSGVGSIYTSSDSGTTWTQRQQ